MTTASMNSVNRRLSDKIIKFTKIDYIFLGAYVLYKEQNDHDD